MNTFRYMFIGLAALALSCQREEIRPEPKILASFDAVTVSPTQTKVSIDGNYILSWDENDKIKVFDGAMEKLYVAVKGGTSTVFQAEGVVLVEGRTYTAVYPDTLGFFNNEGLVVKVSDNMAIGPEDFPAAPAVAIGNGKDRQLEFENVCGLISFEVKGDEVKAVTIEGAQGEVLAGYVSVDGRTGEYDADDISSPSTSIVVRSVLGGGLYPGRYYVPVLPQVFEKGLKITMQTSENALIERFFEGRLDLLRSYYHDLEGVDVGRFFRYEISTAQQLVDFLNDAADPQSKSHVVATLKRDIDLTGVELPSAETFRGTFDGNGKSLKNWAATAPLFRKIEATAKIKDLEIASSCTMTLSGSAEPQAIIVGVNEGLVSNCVNRASFSGTVSSGQAAEKCTFGSIVGANSGKLEGCVNYGNHDVTVSSLTGTALYRFGGLVGNGLSGASMEGCSNMGNISVTYTGEDPQTALTVGGVVAHIEGQGQYADSVNEGAVSLMPGVSSSVAAGGFVALIENAGLEGGANKGSVTLTGLGSGQANVGGVVAKAEGTDENASWKLRNCTNSGTVIASDLVNGVLNAGGIAGWTNLMLEGTGTKALHNEGTIWVKGAAGTANVGGVVGCSADRYSKIYNSGEVKVELGESVTDVRVGGVAGYLSASGLATTVADDKQPSYVVTGQNYGNVTVMGGVSASRPVYIGGVIGLSDIRNMSHNQTSWDLSNTNTADINVNSPVRVVVGGVVARESGKDMPVTNVVGKRTIGGVKNRGNITVTSPGDNSYIGGLIGWHGRGVIGNANNIGRYSATSTSSNDKALITVTGGNETVCVGAVAGCVDSNNGKAWGCSTAISGCGIWCDIDAENTTSGLIAGCVIFSGDSAAAGVMLGSGSGERPKYHTGSLLNGSAVGPLSESSDINTFFGIVMMNGTEVTPIFRTGFAGGNISLVNGLQTY